MPATTGFGSGRQIKERENGTWLVCWFIETVTESCRASSREEDATKVEAGERRERTGEAKEREREVIPAETKARHYIGHSPVER